MSVFEYFPDISVDFSRALGIPIFGDEGKPLGKLKDFFVDYEEIYPSVLAIQYEKNGQLFYINWKDIRKFSYKKVTLRPGALIGRSRTFPKTQAKRVISSLLSSTYKEETLEYPAIGKVVLDRQIVDTHGKKVVRVNDIQFIKSGPNLRVTHAAIGVRSMMRRLGFEKVVDLVVKTVNPKSQYLTSEVLINWKYVHAIPDRSVQSNVKLNLTNEDLSSIHPADLADILEDLDGHGRDQIFQNLDPEEAAATLSEIEPDVQSSILIKESPEDAAKIVENMGTDEAADLLSGISKDKAEAIISNIEDQEIQEDIHELLEYKKDSAGGLMTTYMFTTGPEATKKEILEKIKNENDEYDSIYDLFIIDEKEALLGTCSLKDLLSQSDPAPIGQIMEREDIKSLPPETHWKELAEFMSKYNLISVPIVGTNNELLGIVSVDDILPWLLK